MNDNILTAIFGFMLILLLIYLAFLAISALLGVGAVVGAGNAIYNYVCAFRDNIQFE